MADTLSTAAPFLLLVGLVWLLIRIRRASRAWADRAQLYMQVYAARASKSSLEDILSDIALRRGEQIRPVTRDVAVGAFHGVGFQFYGHSAEDFESGSFLTTQWLTLVWVPIFPIGRYRVVPVGSNKVETIGQLPLRATDWLLAVTGWGILIAFVISSSLG